MKIRIDISDLASDGAGVGRHQGKVVFVALALPGETVTAQVTENKKDFMRARLLQVESGAADRVVPPCPYFGTCGGCQLQHLAYPAQVEFKQKLVRRALERVGRLEGVPEIENVPSPQPYGYRNKMIFPVRAGRGSPARLGFFKLRSHDFLAVDRCLVAGEGINAWIEPVNRFIADVEAYREGEAAGALRHAVLRSFERASVQASFVLREPGGLAGKDFAALGAPSVWINHNPDPGNVILGDAWRHAGGFEMQEVRVRGVAHRLHPGAFFQANTAMLERMIGLADEHVLPGVALVDLYGGAGFFGLHLAGKVPRVVVVEENPLAVASGEASKAASGAGSAAPGAEAGRPGRGDESRAACGIANVEFREAPVEAAGPVLEAMAASGFQVILDPPRKGCSPQVLEMLLAARPQRIVYFSCHPATCSRDIAALAPAYSLDRVFLLDLFPQTSHAEMLAVLSRR